MVAIQGYFDGAEIRLLEKLDAKPNQRVIITIMDEFIEPGETVSLKGIRGILSQYSNDKLIEHEKGAWGHAAMEKHGNV